MQLEQQYKKTEIGLEVEPAQGFYHPKWNGSEWVEGATEFPKVEEVIEVSLEDRVVSIEETLDVLFEGNI